MNERDTIHRLVQATGGIILGKERQIRLALTCLLSRGHLLIEDLPGVGKTTLAHALARILGLGFQRIQFTSDLLPSDVLGVSVYDRTSGGFQFHPGPIFHQVVLADEINRATPKTQSAFLEAMEEEQVTVEGETRPLPAPFFVIATQNPFHQVGTFPLPESQLDRFLMCVGLGYPDAAAERLLLQGEERRTLLARLDPVLGQGELTTLMAQAQRVHVAPALLDYLQALLRFSREAGVYQNGLSPRAGLLLLRAARTWAMMEGRREVIPEDLQSLLPSVAGHRLRMHGENAGHAVQHLIASVPIP